MGQFVKLSDFKGEKHVVPVKVASRIVPTMSEPILRARIKLEKLLGLLHHFIVIYTVCGKQLLLLKLNEI